jgi:hypothetical protein
VQPLASSACLAPERSPLVFPRLRAPTECACEREAIEPTGDAYRCRHQVIGVAKQTVADVGGVVAGLPQVPRLDLEAIPRGHGLPGRCARDRPASAGFHPGLPPHVVAAEYCAGLPASTDPTQQRPVWFTRKTYEIFAAGRLVRLIDAFAN